MLSLVVSLYEQQAAASIKEARARELLTGARHLKSNAAEIAALADRHERSLVRLEELNDTVGLAEKANTLHETVTAQREQLKTLRSLRETAGDTSRVRLVRHIVRVSASLLVNEARLRQQVTNIVGRMVPVAWTEKAMQLAGRDAVILARDAQEREQQTSALKMQHYRLKHQLQRHALNV